MKYKTEHRDFNDCKVLKIFGSQAVQDIIGSIMRGDKL